jgi:hypothetical protein
LLRALNTTDTHATDNTAPFLAYRFIQRFGVSNPSPRYIKAAATAFRDGVYQGIGSGKYADLAATFAAVLLDREARSAAVDLDPASGQLREPLLKVMHLMRSMEMKPHPGKKLVIGELHNMIGMNPYHAPGVFSYFKPEYIPPGPIGVAGLVSPETQILTAPNIMSYLNGVKSLFEYRSLTSCRGGFSFVVFSNEDCDTRPGDEYHDGAHSGALTYNPPVSATPAQVVRAMDLLLTSGRLDKAALELLTAEYQLELNETNNDTNAAVAHVAQIMATAPEFQSTNIAARTGLARESTDREPSTSAEAQEPYKAVVYLFLDGGADSYNILVPHSSCEKVKKDMYAEYKAVRTNVALDKDELLVIDVQAGVQPCDKFGLNPEMPNVARMYSEKDAAFIANTGNLVEPVTKAAFEDASVQLPRSLFAHNIQVESIQNLYPQSIARDGVLGRMADQLTSQGM